MILILYWIISLLWNGICHHFDIPHVHFQLFHSGLNNNLQFTSRLPGNPIRAAGVWKINGTLSRKDIKRMRVREDFQRHKITHCLMTASFTAVERASATPANPGDRCASLCLSCPWRGRIRPNGKRQKMRTCFMTIVSALTQRVTLSWP